MIAFLPNCGITVGLGHLMRCLSLADRLRDMGEECRFFLSDKTACELASQRGFAVEWLERKESGTAGLHGTLKNSGARLFVVDSYSVTSEYLGMLRDYAPVVYLDDVKAFSYPCDVLVNYNIYGTDWEQSYKANQQEFGTKLMLGPQYVPLREEFENLPVRKAAGRVQKVFISTGGSDLQNVMHRLLTMIGSVKEWQSIEFHAVIGALNPYKTELEQAAREMQNIKLHIQERKIAQLMCQCDVAVSAAGSTLYELCACGVPTVTYVLADNQLPGACAFEARALMKMAGDCRVHKIEERIFVCLQELVESASLRSDISRRMQETVDGKGAQRLAMALRSACSR